MKKLYIIICFNISLVLFAGNSASVVISATIPPRINISTEIITGDITVTSNAANVQVIVETPEERIYDDAFFAKCKTSYEKFIISEETGIYPESYRNVQFVLIVAE